jgi:hypothetical protein
VRNSDLPRIEDLPQWKAAEVKNKLAELLRDVRSSGKVA